MAFETASRDLGVGIVWWPALDDLCRGSEGLVDVISAEPEAFWTPQPGQAYCSSLKAALQHLEQPKLLHGVGAPLGGTCPPPRGHTARFAQDLADLRPAYVSEHLSITHFHSTQRGSKVFAGFMLPPLQSAAGMRLAAANIRQRRSALGGAPIAVETPVNYLPPLPGEWPDGEFVAATAEEADCGILLDLHNVSCNARNGRQGLEAFCDSLPLERVWELHLAGGEYEGGYWLDAHAGLVEPELMEFAATLVTRLPQLRAITFEIMPDRVRQVGLGAIARQLGEIRDIWNGRRADSRPARMKAHPPSSEPHLAPEIWEELLGSAINGLSHPQPTGALAGWWCSAAPAIDLYRRLVGEARACAVLAAAPRCTRLLLRARGTAQTRQILSRFWRESSPGYTSVQEARDFLIFLGEQDRGLPNLANAMSEDMAQWDVISG